MILNFLYSPKWFIGKDLIIDAFSLITLFFVTIVTYQYYRIDKTNREIDFFRNKIRLELLPYLEKKYNPSIKNLLAKTTGNLADDYDFINWKAQEVMIENCLFENDNVRIDVKKIKEMHPALQKQVLRQAILQIKGNLKDVESSHIEEILKIVKSNKGKNQRVGFKGLKVMRKGDIIQISV